MNNVIVDMSPLIYASYFALHEKISWWMVYGVLNSILNIVTEEDPDTLMLVWGSKKNKKNDLYPAYRRTRTVKIKFDEKQFQILLSIFSKLNVIQLKKDGVEADQIIAACANSVGECVIISEDKDFFQLLTDFRVLKGRKRGLFDAKRVCAKYDLKEAHLMADLQALTGDRSDNIPRILSMRDAKHLLNVKGSLDKWFFKTPQDLDNVSKLIAERLNRESHQLNVNYELVDLRNEKLQDDYYLPRTIDFDWVKDKLKKMNMRSFLKRFEELEELTLLDGTHYRASDR